MSILFSSHNLCLSSAILHTFSGGPACVHASFFLLLSSLTFLLTGSALYNRGVASLPNATSCLLLDLIDSLGYASEDAALVLCHAAQASSVQ